MPPLLDSNDYERQIQPSPNIKRGGIKLFGLETRLASDDFVLPAWIAFLFHLFYLIATSGIMAYSMQILKTGPSCINSYYLDIYMILAVSFLIIISILDITLALNSARGVIWDDDPNSRKWVSVILHCSFIFGIFEVLLVCIGSVWISSTLQSDCAHDNPAEQTSIYVILGLLVSKWIGICFTIMTIILSLKDLCSPSRLCCRKSPSDVNETLANDAGNSTRVLQSEISQSSSVSVSILDYMTPPGDCCFTIFKRCCIASKQIEYFNDVGDFIHKLFEDNAFVPTDVAAALILLSTKSEFNTESENSVKSMKNKELYLKNLEDYMAYGTAIYGPTVYLFDGEGPVSRFSKLLSNLSLCPCCCCFPWSNIRMGREDFIEKDHYCGCHLTTTLLILPHIEENDIIYLSLKNDFLETPFMIVADRKLEKIVISIRGTLSLSDLMTDMVARPVGLKSKVWALFQNGQIDLTDAEQNNLNQLPDDIEVHSGMAEAAIYMLKEIKGKHLLEQAFVHFPDYPIVITGHSLGAGTAVILAFLLRLKYSNVRCYAFGPPGALLNPSASMMSKQFVTSIVVGDDIVPRLSMNGYIELRSNMKKALLKCRLPKHKILATGFCNCLSPETWKERLKNDPSVSSYHERNNHHYGSMEVVNEDDEESDTFDTQSWPEMLPPGKIIHMQETKENNLTMCFREPQDFKEIIISTKMINDHAPSSYQSMLKKLTVKFVSRNSIEV